MFPSQLPDASVVKSTVKASLKGKRIQAAVVSAAVVFAYYSVYMVTGVLSSFISGGTGIAVIAATVLLLIFLLLPLMFGAIRYFLRLTDGVEDEPLSVFYYFSSFFRYKRAVKCVFWMIFKCLTAIATCMLPFFIVSVLSQSWFYRFVGAEIPFWIRNLSLIEAFLKYVGEISVIAVISRYYLLPAIAIMDDDVLLLEATHISVMISRHTVVRFFSLGLSLIGWLAVGLFGFPSIFTLPIILSCYAVHCRYALVNYNLSLDSCTENKYDTSI